MEYDFSSMSDEELDKALASAQTPAPAAPQGDFDVSAMSDEELNAALASAGGEAPRMSREERIAQNQRAIERAQQPGDGEDGFDLAVLEGVKGAARAVKDIGGGIVGMVSGAARLAGTPVRLATGWEGLHRLADTIDSSYENFGRDALMSEYGENPDGWGYALGRAGEKVAGVAGSLAALGGVGKAVGAAGTALKAAGHAKTAAAVANTLPLMFGNDAAVRAYDTARANGKSKGEAAALAGLNGAIHFLGFKAFENQSLKKMLNIGPEVEVMMPKWADALAEEGGQSFSSLVRGTRNGMVKYIAAERGKGALKAGGIMGLQDMLSDPVMQVAEGADIDDIDFSRMLKAGAHGVGEGALMEGLMGGAAIFRSQKAAEKFMADKFFRGKDYKVMGADGKMHDEPGLLNSEQGRMMLMKQNPAATERVLDIVEHGGMPRPVELDAAFLPPDMTAEELKKFASDWRNDLKPYVDEAWEADAPRQTAAPDAASAEPGRDMLSPEEAQSQQKAANDAAERQKVADRRAAADSMMLDFESWNRLYADGKTDLNFDEWRAAGKPGVIEANLTPKTEEAPTSETRANEEPAQPEQAEVVAPATGAEARPVESAEARAEATDARVVAQPAVWPNGWDNAGEEIKGYVVPNDGDVAPGREVAIAHRSGGSINAPQKIKGVVESVDGDTVKVYYRDGMGYDQHDTFKKSELVGVMPLTAVPTEGATSQTAQDRAGVAQERAGARPASETATTTPAPAKPAEAPSRMSGVEGARTPPAERIPDSKGKMVKPKAAESDYGVTMFEEPAVDGEGVSYVVKDGPSDAHRMMFKSKSEAEARLAELRAERKAIKESPSATLADGKKVRLLKTDEGWIPYDENYNDLRHGMFNAAKTKAEAIKVAEKGVKWARDLAEENARFKAEAASRVSDAEPAVSAPAPAPATQTQTNIPNEKKSSAQESASPSATWTDRGGTTHKLDGFDPPSADNITKGRTVAIRHDNGVLYSGELVGIGPKNVKIKTQSDMYGEQVLTFPKADVVGVKSNRLRRADGTDPLAENPMPKTVRKAVDKISLAISNRTGTGIITPEEADGIVRGIVESPETKHNRYRDFFNPLENDAKWRESLGLDAESAKNIRDAFDRVKADADLKKWFPQVDAAVKKANDGRLSKKDAAPLFGKISEGLEKAERMGLSEAANRLREAVEVIRPVAETVEQGDVNKFNYSTKGKKLNNRLGGTDKRGGKTVSLDTKNGTVDVGADGKGSTLGGNRHLIIDGVKGDELTVTMKDAAGKILATRKMNRAQWSALAKGAVATDGDPANPQKGDLIRMSRNGESPAERDLRFASDENYQKWLKSRKANDAEPLREHYEQEQAKAAKSIARNSLPGVDVEVVDRAFNPETDGGNRQLLDGEGRVVGTFDRSTNKVKLYRGASAATLVHELGGHATLRFAEQEAERGNRQLLDRINRAIDEAPQALKDEIRSRYPRVDETALRDEIWAALRERNSPAMEKAIKTLQGKAWYNRAWSAFRDAWKGLLARMGFNRADLSQIDKMSNDEFLSHLDRIMSDGKTLGRLEAMGEGTRNAFAGEKDNEYEASREDAAKAMPDTKIVGSDGKPVAGYHFTKSKDGFTVFDREKSGPGMFGKAFYFFPSKRMAENWGNFDGEKRKVIGAYLDVKKPWVDSLAGYDDNTGFDKAHLRKPTDAEYATLVGKLKENGYEINPNYSYAGMTPYKYVNGKQVPVNHGLAFLSNALVHKSDRGGYGWKHAEPVRKALEELGYDGVVGELDGYTQIAVFEPNQIKSADSITYDDAGNPIPLSQRFNPKSDDIREARSPRPAGSRIMDDQQTKGEKFTEKFIDSLAPVKSVQEELGGVKEITRADGYTDHTKSTDLVAAKDKANGRLEHEVRQHQFRVDDINRDLARAALPKQSTEDLVDDFNLYLQCKHAPERNLSVAQDRGDAYTPDYSEGMGQITLPGGNRIGLSENVADRLLKGMRGKYGLKFKMFENAADKVYKMLEADLDRRFDAGRLSAEDYAFYKTRWHGPGGADGKWAHYVPLKTDMERLEPEALNSSTAGMKRNEFMKAQGRGTGDIADSPLAAAVLQTEQGIRGSIKNEVANVEANLVEHAQKQGIPIAEIVPGDEIRRGRTYSFTFADGETVDASGSMRLVENHPEIHLFKRDGKLYAIRYDKGANGRGLAFAKAASGENMGRWGQGLEWIPHMTHLMSAMRTQYSPEFTVSNWLADHLEAAQALVGRYGLKEGGKAFAKTVASEIRNAKDLFRYLNGGQANGYIKEFVEGGGLTKGGVASEGFDAETQKIRSKIEQFRREQKQWRKMSPADLAKSAGRHVADFLSFANELAEYSTRTGLYTALRKQGVPQAEAIKFARDATVNFNRKGTAMPYINGLYMFANASVQGAVRSVQAMRDTHGKELVAALTAIGVAKAVIDNYLGNDDEREAAGGRNARNQSEYDKKHNVGVPIGGGRQIVPLRFRGPYAAVPYLAQTAANVAMGATSPEDGAKTLFRELGDQVTDLVGGNGIMNDKGELDGALIGQSIAPSVADLIVQLATGKDYKGEERRQKSFDKTMPASSNGKRSTASGYKWLAKGVNAIPFLSGGNEFRKGRLDFSPEDYKLVLEFLGGAPMRDINNVASSVNNAVQLASGGTPERTLSQIPFVRRVVREYPESTSRYYDALEEYERDKAEFKKTTPERRREMKADKPYLFTGKSLLDGQIERIKELTHLERGEVKVGQKWVEPKTPRTEEQKEKYRKLRLEMQARVLKRLGE